MGRRTRESRAAFGNVDNTERTSGGSGKAARIAGIPLRGSLRDKKLGTSFTSDKESFGKCDRGGGRWGNWVAGLLGGKGIPCRRGRAGAGVTCCVWARRAVAAAACKKREDEATGGGDGFREGFCDAHDETATVEGAAGRTKGSASGG
jgi:hypothetical protein